MHNMYVRTGTIDVRQSGGNQSAYQQLPIHLGCAFARLCG